LSDKHDLVPPEPGQGEWTVSTRTMELVVAAVLMLVAAVVMIDSWRVGAGWAVDGPQAGYFPFYIGAIMFVSSAITFGVHVFTKTPNLSNFVGRSALLMVLKVLAPTVGFVVLIEFLGIYVAAAIFIPLSFVGGILARTVFVDQGHPGRRGGSGCTVLAVRDHVPDPAAEGTAGSGAGLLT